MDYVIVEKSALSRLVDVHVPMGDGGGICYYLLLVEKLQRE